MLHTHTHYTLYSLHEIQSYRAEELKQTIQSNRITCEAKAKYTHAMTFEC